MDTNPGTTSSPLSSADVEARITAERHRLLTEQNLEQELAGQRLAPLEAGDDEALDRVEVQINGCRERQIRTQERIELLQQRLSAAQDRERDAELDRLARIADRARAMGEALISADYAEQAQALVGTLSKLSAINALIEQINARLHSAGHRGVPMPNAIRCRPGRTWDETVIKRVGLSESLHPYHGKASRSPNSDFAYPYDGGEMVPAVMDVEVVEHRHESAMYEPDITEAVKLPGVGPAPVDHCLVALWNEQATLAARARASDLLAEIEATLNASAAGRLLKSAARVLSRRNERDAT